MNHTIRDRIARKMWKMYQEANRPHFDHKNCPTEFYYMSELAMKEVAREFGNMVLRTQRGKLEDLYNQPSQIDDDYSI